MVKWVVGRPSKKHVYHSLSLSLSFSRFLSLSLCLSLSLSLSLPISLSLSLFLSKSPSLLVFLCVNCIMANILTNILTLMLVQCSGCCSFHCAGYHTQSHTVGNAVSAFLRQKGNKKNQDLLFLTWTLVCWGFPGEITIKQNEQTKKNRPAHPSHKRPGDRHGAQLLDLKPRTGRYLPPFVL